MIAATQSRVFGNRGAKPWKDSKLNAACISSIPFISLIQAMHASSFLLPLNRGKRRLGENLTRLTTQRGIFFNRFQVGARFRQKAFAFIAGHFRAEEINDRAR